MEKITLTPKEKASKLCDAFYQYLPIERYVTTTEGDLSWEYNSWENAKQCAIIAVDEILELNYPAETLEELDDHITYWDLVIEEIEKL